MASAPSKPPSFPPPGGPNTGREKPASRPPSAPRPVQPGEKTKDFLQSAPKLELPKGGGAIQGIGEKFQANPATGTASLSVPIALSPGRQGFTPALALSYDSGAGNGPFGLGWSLGVPRIQRKTDKGLPEYRDRKDSDTFVLSEAEDLVPCLTWDSGTSTWTEPTLADATDGASTWSRRRFRPRVDAAIARIERWTEASSGEVHWRTWTRDNVCRVYGLSAGARLADPDDSDRVFAWYIEEERDEVGNRILYEYAAEDRAGAPATPAERLRDRAGHAATFLYLKRVFYGNTTPFTDDGNWLFEVVFDYGEHPGEPTDSPLVPPSHTGSATWACRQDIFSSFRARFDVRCYRLCQRVLLFHRFGDPSGATEPTLVRSTELAYDASPVATTVRSVTQRGWKYDSATTTWSTLAMPAVEFTYGEAVLDESVQFVEGLEDLPMGLDTSRWRFVDLDGDGMAGLLAECGADWYFKRNNGGGAFAPMRRVPLRPQPGASGNLADLDGDSRQELVVHQPGMHGFAFRDDQGDWQAFKPFRQVPNVDWDSPDLRQLDLDGDGLPDLLITEHDRLTWYPSEGREGWSEARSRRNPPDERDGPRLLFSSEREAIFLADMVGDGLTDLVRVRAGLVEYWPNRGMGRFGGRVVMANSPKLGHRFDPARVRLADIDGSGPADLIYLGPDGVHFWQNQCGNGFDDGTSLTQFPGIDNASSVQVADLLGDGTACLVWSSALLRDAWCPLRFVHLMAEGKPYLLKTVTNNLGRVTTLTYASSTEFMAEDRAAGTPWATRLPFPVQCLTKVEVRDDVTGWRNTTTYAYHHGYYDSAEREFRGFGKVEQWDTEQLGTYEDSARGTDAALDLDPVRTVSWFHTGAWRQQGSLEAAYEAEYWTGDADAEAAEAWPGEHTREDAPISGATFAAWTPAERREAARALKGRPLRVEVYAEDGASTAGDPYAVTATTWIVARVQPAGDNPQASFIVVAKESFARHYERVADDPRTSHELTLDYDANGTVRQKASIGYPRRDVADRTDAQDDLTVVVAESEVIDDTSAIDAETDPDAMHWHVGVASRATSWHLTSDTWQTAGAWNVTDLASFDADDLATALSGATGIPFEQAASSGVEKRALSVEAKVYWLDDLSGPAAAGTMESRALPYQAYKKAFTASLASTTYADLPSDADFEDAGHVDLDADGDWWAASGTATLSAANFYQPDTLTDPFGNTTTLTHDSVGYFVLSAEDPLGNTVTVEMDEVALQPTQVQDPNENLTLAEYDALGRLMAVAVQGKATESLGDTLAHPTVAYSYELDRWANSGLPVHATATFRAEHGGTETLVRVAYSDGAGNVVQEKVSAEPDPTTSSTPRWVATGRVVLNNKGLPVKQFEPYFSSNDECEFEDEAASAGVSSTVFSDPVGRATKVQLPNGCLRKTTFSPWEQAFSDENDTSADSDCTGDAALVARAADHAATPTTVFLDHLGRPVSTDELVDNVGTTYTTSLTLDVQGNPLVVTDPRGNAIQTQVFDMLGRPLSTTSPDAGDATVFMDTAGQPIRVWKSGDLLVEFAYDALRRRTTLLVTEGAATPRLVEVNEYGESQGSTLNHNGRLYRQWDTAGRVVNDAYDFKGNLISQTRRFWDWETNGEEVTWGDDAADTPSDTLLESEEFTSEWAWDALNRVRAATAPDGQVTAVTFDAGGLLDGVTVDSATFVDAILYNARGQRAAIEYGNGVSTEYSYDSDTFRLATLTTTRAADSKLLQDLTYEYDPVGNITAIGNAAEDAVFFSNAVVTPDQEFQYDALYRLTNAWGREKSARSRADWAEPAYGSSIPDAAETMQSYEQRYTYDEAGNIEEMRHLLSSTTDWVRTYAYDTGSNRLSTTTETAGTVSYQHSARGAIVFWPHLYNDGASPGPTPNVEVDFRDQMRRAQLNANDYALYFYDRAGQRVRKVVKKGANVEDRKYILGYEVWRKTVSGTLDEERTTLHVTDGESRIAMVETKTVEGGTSVSSPIGRVRYQLGNHLGSAVLELDDTGQIISHEEYHPYGSTAWWAADSTAVSRRRYRYTGMERDEETGLQCHGVRYYAPWLGRWTSADPIGLGDGVNRFQYCHANPTCTQDNSGMAAPSGVDQAEAERLDRGRATATRAAAELQALVDSGLAKELGVTEYDLTRLQSAIGALKTAKNVREYATMDEFATDPSIQAAQKDVLLSTTDEGKVGGLYQPTRDAFILPPEGPLPLLAHEADHRARRTAHPKEAQELETNYRARALKEYEGARTQFVVEALVLYRDAKKEAESISDPARRADELQTAKDLYSSAVSESVLHARATRFHGSVKYALAKIESYYTGLKLADGHEITAGEAAQIKGKAIDALAGHRELSDADIRSVVYGN